MALIQTQPRRKGIFPKASSLLVLGIIAVVLAFFLYFGLRPVTVTTETKVIEYSYDDFKAR